MRRHRARDERGATAVLVTLLALVLFAVGALAIDMGQVYAKRAALQSNVDLAVLAAAAELDNPGACNDEVVDAATAYLGKDGNAVADQYLIDLGGAPDDGDGHIRCAEWRVELWAPAAHADFTMGESVGAEGVDVPAYAAATVFSPRMGAMPAYAVSGCDFGLQTLLDDSPGGGSTPPPVPALPWPTDSSLDIDSLDPAVILVDEITDLEIRGSGLRFVTTIGFTVHDGTEWVQHTVPASSATSSRVRLDEIPASVRTVEGEWFVQVSDDGGATWSAALRLQVGDPMLECASGPSDGNFGALALYRDPEASTNDRLALNFALGSAMTLARFPVPGFPWTCSDGVNGAVESSPGDPVDGTNCVDTDTGLPAQAAEAGLLTGKGISELGRLDVNRPDNHTHPDCDATSDLSVDFGGSTGSRTLNNDYLTCFLTDDTTTISTIGPGYAGPPVLSEEILESPRFYLVPVLGVEPSHGGSQRYQIVDFRPAFITDQPGTATRINPQIGVGGTENGLGFAELGGNKRALREVKVVFFSSAALPESVSPDSDVMGYLGAGPKVIRLVE